MRCEHISLCVWLTVLAPSSTGLSAQPLSVAGHWVVSVSRVHLHDIHVMDIELATAVQTSLHVTP